MAPSFLTDLVQANLLNENIKDLHFEFDLKAKRIYDVQWIEESDKTLKDDKDELIEIDKVFSTDEFGDFLAQIIEEKEKKNATENRDAE